MGGVSTVIEYVSDWQYMFYGTSRGSPEGPFRAGAVQPSARGPGLESAATQRAVLGPIVRLASCPHIRTAPYLTN